MWPCVSQETIVKTCCVMEIHYFFIVLRDSLFIGAMYATHIRYPCLHRWHSLLFTYHFSAVPKDYGLAPISFLHTSSTMRYPMMDFCRFLTPSKIWTWNFIKYARTQRFCEQFCFRQSFSYLIVSRNIKSSYCDCTRWWC